MTPPGRAGFKLARLRLELMVRVDPRNTSRTCSACGHVSPENRKMQEAFVCVACGHAENADAKAARNILRAGHARCACSPGQPGEFVA